MNNFERLMEELSPEMKRHSYTCADCGKQHEVMRPKFKHNRTSFENMGKGIVVNGNFHCKKCVKNNYA